MSERGSGGVLGHYELRRLLGRGGMGEVHEAYDTRRGRVVALKVLPEHLARDEEYRRRFQREARIAARVNTPHVVPIHDFGEVDGLLFIDMRVVEGIDLRRMLREHGPLDPGAVHDVVSQLADALDAAHADGLVHRDVKPANVLVQPSGFVYLVDFGVATHRDEDSLTQAGDAVGSLDYMAPECFAGSPPDGSVDIYALGCLTYEMLTGRVPFRRDSVEAKMAAHLHEDAPPPSTWRPDLPAGVDAVLARAMAKDPSRRYRTARELSGALAEAVGGGPARPGERVGLVSGPLVATSGASWPAATTEGVAAATPSHRPASVPHPVGASRAAGSAPQPAPMRRTGLVLGLGVLAVLLGAGSVGAYQLMTDDEGTPSAGESAGSSANRPQQSLAGSQTGTEAPGSSPSTDRSASPDSSGTDGSASSTPDATSTTTTSPPTTTDGPTPSAPTSGDGESSSASPTATGTGSSGPAPTTSSSTSGPDVGPTLDPGPGYDWQGWSAPAAARCNADDRALAVARTAAAQVSICEVGPGGRTYYRGSAGSGSLEIDDPTPTGAGWTAVNGSYTYAVGPDRLVVTRGGETVVDDPLSVYRRP